MCVAQLYETVAEGVCGRASMTMLGWPRRVRVPVVGVRGVFHLCVRVWLWVSVGVSLCAGWGGPGGYVYQKAYVECFASPKHLAALLTAAKSWPSITYFAVDKRGNTYTNAAFRVGRSPVAPAGTAAVAVRHRARVA